MLPSVGVTTGDGTKKREDVLMTVMQMVPMTYPPWLNRSDELELPPPQLDI